MPRPVAMILLLFVVTSCSEQLSSERQTASSNSLRQFGLATQNYHDTSQNVPAGDNAMAQPPSSAGATPTAENTAAQPSAGRHIIYRASVHLHVASFEETDKKIASLVNDSGGYISQFSEDRSYGAQRGGRWTVRVPDTKFTAFLHAVSRLGVAERREVQSQDVTEEFIDLGSRLKNKQALETRLLELVANRGDAIKDVLALEAELSRVREEIEKLQGRIRYLTDRIALTTVEITAYERLDYEPPEARFGKRLATTFYLSLDRLRQFGEAVLLVLTAIGPWAVAGAIVLLPIGALIRRLSRRAHGTRVTSPAA